MSICDKCVAKDCLREGGSGCSAFMPENNSNPWHYPSKGELPTENEQIMVYAWNVHHVIAKYTDGRFVTFDAYSPIQKIDHVIAWMPLPETPKENA